MKVATGSVTGPAAFLGDPELKTLQMYVEDINKKGGVLGRRQVLVAEDEHRMAIHAGADLLQRRAVADAAQIDGARLGGEQGM